MLKSASTNFKFTLGDPSAHADGAAFTLFADPLASLAFLSTAASVTQDRADGTYRGTFDPSKITRANAATRKVVDLLVEKRAGRTDPIPFTARVDSEGRLEKFTMLVEAPSVIYST